MTDDEKLAYVGGTDWFYIRGIGRLDIPKIRIWDGPNGVCYSPSTTYPADVALAASWNRALAQRYGRSLGRDCRARGLNFILGPGVNIYRAPMCGRNFEYMGEDPYLAGQMAVNYIQGVQSQGVSAVVKHFFGNNSEYDRNYVSNDMDERTMHEIYLPAFKTAIQDGKCGAVMTSYNLTGGIYTTHDHNLLTTILRERWGFKGLVMSDWGSTHD
ncbi:MAG: glycoside hydrolase family 3 protein, partial [Bacteroidaceae bacterium]|nr:glycoside hydrolase family 3 protein [Bacteroidaceae bacterium]